MSAHTTKRRFVRSALGTAIAVAFVVGSQVATAGGRLVQIEQLDEKGNPVERTSVTCASAVCRAPLRLLIDDTRREVEMWAIFQNQGMHLALHSMGVDLAINGQVYAYLLLDRDGTAKEIVDLREYAPLLRTDQPSMLLHKPVYRGSLRKLGKLRISVNPIDDFGGVRTPRDGISP